MEDLARLACSTRKILGVAPVLLARAPLANLVSFCFIPVGSDVASYLGGLSTTNTSISISFAIDSATSKRVLDCSDTSENKVVGGDLLQSRSEISLVPVARIAK